MVFARRATVPVDADDGYGVPHPSPRVQMTMDALRRELWEEGIRQEVIAAEIAEQQELEAKVQRNPEFPSLHGEIWLGRPMAMPAGPSMFRGSVKDRIEEWYRPPWRRTADDENASFNGTKMHKKVSSRVKRKRGADTFLTNNKKTCVPRSCGAIQVNTRNEFCFEEHFAGHRHEENDSLESRKEAIGMKKKVEAESLSATRHYPPTWNCGICKANCSSELDLKNHLRGRRHQENSEALEGRQGNGSKGVCKGSGAAC